jgi:peptidoglycan hydrolase-like protein with peptidoglycan-binding domain
MKKIVLALGLVMAFALVGVASAATLEEQTAALQLQVNALLAQIATLSGTTAATTGSVPTITANLTIGSKGDEVTALQMYLEDEDLLVMPVGVDYGYFGPLTKSAVVAWQAANGVSPTSGYFGPISRAALDAIRVASPIVTPAGDLCPNGMTLASNCTVAPAAAVDLCPNGMTLASNCTAAPAAGGTVGLDNTDGSITFADAAYVSTGATFKKGETRNIYDVRLTATGGKVAVNRLDVKFSEKPYLTLNKLVLKDSTGMVIAEKMLSSMADVTEVTIGSDYRVRFDNINYVVTPGTDATLVISATSMASSDKITTQTVTVSIPAGGIRTINGKGYTETSGAAITAKTFTFSSTGSVADLNATISSDSPAKRNVTTSATTETPDVVLGVYNLKAVNSGATMSSLSVLLNSSTGVATSTLLTNLRLVDANGREYGASSLAAGSQTFTNMAIRLEKDVWTKVTLKATINANQSLTASTTLDVSTIIANDDNDNTMTLTNASDVTAYDVVFSTGALDLVSSSVVPGEAVYAYGTSAGITNKNVDFVFALKNNSNNVLYASSTLSQLMATSSTGSATGATVSSSTMQSLSVTPADPAAVSGNYAINPGETRTFTVKGLISKIAGATQYSELKITGINYSGSTITAGTINFGLESLRYGLSM